MGCTLCGGGGVVLEKQAQPLPFKSVRTHGEDPVPEMKFRIRNQKQSGHIWRNIMVYFVVFYLWITSSNLVLAAPHDPTIIIPETPSETTAEATSETPLRSVTFSYNDSDFEQVFLSGSFTQWVKLPMVRQDGVWTLTLSIPESRQYYNFMVDEGSDSWVAIDPENQETMNHEDFGWVSVLSTENIDKTQDYNKKRTRHKDRKDYIKGIRTELKHGISAMGDVTYQRVDGFVLGTGVSHYEKKGSMGPSARARIHLGFSSGRLGGNLSVLQPLLSNHLLDLKLNLFHKTEINNHITGIGIDENSLAGFLLHEDYFDYHHSEGAKLSLVFKLGNWLRLQGGLRSEEQESLWGPSVWSVKSGDFIKNPAIDEGNLNSLFANFVVGGKFNYISASYQRSDENLLGGDFEFEKIDARLRGRLKLGDDAGFDLRLSAGSNLSGHLPAQERYLLGGLGTVRGYSYQSLMVPESAQASSQYGGQRMAMGNLEYFFRMGKCLKFNLFYDAGMVWEDKDAEVSLNDLKSSAGIGLNLGKGDGLRINMIQRLDDRKQPVVFQLRLKRMF